jgi:hypothetical protein
MKVFYNDILFEHYLYDFETNQVIGKNGRPLKPSKNKYYHQVSCIHNNYPHNIQMEKLHTIMNERRNNLDSPKLSDVAG